MLPILKSAILRAAILVLLWLGFTQPAPGLVNIGTFAVWAWAVFSLIAFIAGPVEIGTASLRFDPLVRLVFHAADSVIVAMLVWFGAWPTAMAILLRAAAWAAARLAAQAKVNAAFTEAMSASAEAARADNAASSTPPVRRMPYRAGALIRYSTGPTAIMRIDKVSPGHGGDVARYYGQQCMGGAVAAYHADCAPASAADLATWEKHNPAPDRAPEAAHA